MTFTVLTTQSLYDIAPTYRDRARNTQPLAPRKQPMTAPTSLFLNTKTKHFAVDGTAFPDVEFDIGESYAGLLPISNNTNDPNQLFFWFFPSNNPAAKNEVTIWLNGGPGCSSMIGVIQENGPFLWQPGTFAPFANPYSWNK